MQQSTRFTKKKTIKKLPLIKQINYTWYFGYLHKTHVIIQVCTRSLFKIRRSIGFNINYLIIIIQIIRNGCQLYSILLPIYWKSLRIFMRNIYSYLFSFIIWIFIWIFIRKLYQHKFASPTNIFATYLHYIQTCIQNIRNSANKIVLTNIFARSAKDLKQMEHNSYCTAQSKFRFSNPRFYYSRNENSKIHVQQTLYS